VNDAVGETGCAVTTIVREELVEPLSLDAVSVAV